MIDAHDGVANEYIGFMDLRQTIQRLESVGDLHRVRAEVDWNREIGALTRRVLEMKGPALLFESIKGYRSGRCTKLVTSLLAGDSRLRFILGLPAGASNRDIVRHIMKKNRETIAPVRVATGPVKENIVTGDAIDLFDAEAVVVYVKDAHGERRAALRGTPGVLGFLGFRWA